MKPLAILLALSCAVLSACGGSAPTTHSEQVSRQVVPAPTSFASFGDSITLAAQVEPGKQWVSQVAQGIGLSNHNYSHGSDQAFDTVPIIFSVPTPDNGVTTWLTGENEWDFYYPTERGNDWLPFLMAGYAHLLIPDSVKTFASSATIDGSVIYVAVKADYGSSAQATVTIDGHNYGSYQTATDHITYWGSTTSPMLIRVPVASGRHSVSVAGATVYWLAGNGWISTRSRQPIVYAANMYLAEKPAPFYPWINALNKQAIDTLKGDGLDIRFVDVFTACGTRCNDADGTHPGLVGNDVIASAFIAAMR